MNLWVVIIVPLAILVVQIVWDKLRERSKQPIWYYKTEEIISTTNKFADDIEIHFKGQKVAQASITRIGLVNVGKDAIDQTDIKSVDHELKISFDTDIHILQAPRLLKSSREDIGFQAVARNREVFISFNLLDYRDGAIMEIVHTGDKNTKVSISGVIKGVPKGILERSYQYASNRVKFYHCVSGSISTALLVFVTWKLIPALFVDISYNNVHWLAASISVLLVVSIVLSIIDHATQFFRSFPSYLSIEI